MPRADCAYFLFYLLRIFKWPNSVILGTVGIPTILMVLLLAAVPRPAAGAAHPSPVAVVITILTVIALER